jgi:hypothetical protein
MSAKKKLIEIAGSPFTGILVTGMAAKNQELKALLGMKNGFFAFESALRVFPAGDSSRSYSLDEWNSSDLWRNNYGKLALDLLFFAEDIFGTQFCLKDERVYSFDPETADLTLIGNNLEDWAQAILDDYNLLTGYSLAHEWQVANRELTPRERLMPKLPFVCGGEFALDNLIAIDAARSMRTRGNLANQIHTLADGAQIRFQIVD